MFWLQRVPQEVSQQLVVWSLFKLKLKDYLAEVLDRACVITAELGNRVVCFPFLHKVETLVTAQILGQVYPLQISTVQKVDKEVTQRDQVISSAGHLEVELVQTGEDHVASEGLDLLGLDMLSGLLVDVPLSESKVHQMKRAVVEAVLALWIDFVLEAHEHIVQLDVVVSEASCVDTLEHSEHTDSKL